MLDRTWQLAFTMGHRADELIEHAVAVATRGGASIVDPQVPRLGAVSDRPGLAVGDAADILLLAGVTGPISHNTGADTTGLDGMGADSLWLRPLTVDDADVMSSVLSDPSLYEFDGGEPPTRDELTRRYAVQTRGHSPDGSQKWVNSVVVLGAASQPAASQPIGYVQATIPVNGDPAEVAWVIGTSWQGRGYATRAARLLLDDLAQQGIGSVMAHIHPRHTASRRIATHLGMTPTTIIVEGETRWAGTTAYLSSRGH